MQFEEKPMKEEKKNNGRHENSDSLFKSVPKIKKKFLDQ